MRTKIAIIFIVLLCELAIGADIAVVASARIRAVPSTERVKALIREIAAEFRLPDARVPNIVVICLSREEARAQRLPPGARTVADRIDYDGVLLYHIWIVDDVTDFVVAEAIATAIARESAARPGAAEIRATARRVCQRLKYKIDVKEFAAKTN